MQKQYVIDIGTNSVRMMCAAVEGRTLHTQYKKLASTRIGEGVDANGVLSEAAIVRTAAVVRTFVSEANGAPVFIFATSAVRDATNRDVFLNLIYEQTGLEVDLLSGEQEALSGLEGALSGSLNGGMIDIGGGSTEFGIKKQGEAVYTHSFQVGCVRCMELFPGEKLDETRAWARNQFAQDAKLSQYLNTCLYAIGGTPTALAAIVLELQEYSREIVHGHMLKKDALEQLLPVLKEMTIVERTLLYPMDERRAEVVGYGLGILLGAMDVLDLEEVLVSEADNLEGYLIRKLHA